LIELKESKDLPKATAERERAKLLEARAELQEKPKRGYLVYVARYGDPRVLRGPKRGAAYYFFEVPIVLAPKGQTLDRAWRQEFRRWSKYKSGQEVNQ